MTNNILHARITIKRNSFFSIEVPNYYNYLIILCKIKNKFIK